MRADIVICSSDAVFARMLELEFSHLLPSVQTVARFSEDLFARVVLLDLDTAVPPSPACYGCLIGFTRGTAFAAEDRAKRQCSMILRRPFEMHLLRREVMGQLTPSDGKIADATASVASFSVASSGKISLCGQVLSLSPNEQKILTYLLDHRGEAVSRERLSALIGETATNKTDVYVCYLRRKLAAITPVKLIQTVRNQGYMLI
jgi:hypothetical protein